MTILCLRFQAVAYFVLCSHKAEVLPVLPLVYWNQKIVRSELVRCRSVMEHVVFHQKISGI